jgi:CRISPR-associated protein Cmr1
MMTLIEASYRLTTPLFGGGAIVQMAESGRSDEHKRSDEQKLPAELRLPSFKGVLRFWWRALAWSRCNGNLPQIQQEENLLFGSISSGQARVLMRLGAVGRLDRIDQGKNLNEAKGEVRRVGIGARYLGYGLIEAFGDNAGKLKRPAILAPLVFTVQLRASALDSAQLASLLEALIALGTFGGMGSRSRKGYGSLALQSLTLDGASPRLAGDPDPWRAPRNACELAGCIAALQQQTNLSVQPTYTAFSSQARYVVLSGEDCKNALHLLDLVGREMVQYRSWGNEGWILDRQVRREEIFKDDHDLMKIKPVARTCHPRRIAFGLPHNYGKGKTNEVTPASFDRRASPLFIHIHQCGSDPVAVVSFLPALFLPAERGGGPAQINVGGKKIPQKHEPELYKPIHTFLDRLLDRTPSPHHRKEAYTSALEVTSRGLTP